MERDTSLGYNTERKNMVISEYGRIIHEYIDIIIQESNRDKRTRMSKGLISVMENLNPAVKQQEDYLHKLWDHLYIISDFKLDVDSPFPPPSKEIVNTKPEPIPYPTQPIKFRFYGRNLQYFLDKALSIQNEEERNIFLGSLASFMKNSSKSWNNEDLTDETIVNHIKSMTQGRINVTADDLVIKIDNSPNQIGFVKKKKNFKYGKNFSKKRNNFKNR
jgi:hypothetical protein